MDPGFPVPDLLPAAAEIVVLLMACVILIIDLFLPERRRWITYGLCLVTLALAAVATAFYVPRETVITFSGTFVSDPLARILKLFVYIVVAAVFLFSKDYLRDRDLFRGEYYLLGLFATLGIMVMISAHSMLSLYLGLELMSLSLYAMVAFARDNPVAAESAMKYFVLGAIASGCFLFGTSILYGVTGTLDISEIARAASTLDRLNIHLLFALSFILVGVAFKFGAVPFHMWIPDVYQGAPTSVTLFIGSAAKVASLAMLLRVLVEGLWPLHPSWSGMLVVMSILSMAIGNIVAIAQTNLKRMLAYSTISHVGFILMGVLSGSRDGVEAAVYYTLAYVIMAVAAFGMILLLSRRGFEAEELEDFRGLNARSRWFAGIMLVVMFSMAGVPPFLGFWAKLEVLGAAVEAGMVWLAVAGVIFSVIGAFYYLRVVKLMYFEEPENAAPVAAGVDLKLILSINGLLIVWLGVFPQSLIGLSNQAIIGFP
ncbi:MAG: NADH:ubiquinone oxidoreductase subunit N [Gammaproteobacteria bacterium SG8_31]|jgi:NADH-quinone oxidoreductase subunit N|nr:MAG: NADH:ubiquinone oxidoreductase subunit N [Gammaproteobacteria bacterium SG8_31]